MVLSWPLRQNHHLFQTGIRPTRCPRTQDPLLRYRNIQRSPKIPRRLKRRDNDDKFDVRGGGLPHRQHRLLRSTGLVIWLLAETWICMPCDCLQLTLRKRSFGEVLKIHTGLQSPHRHHLQWRQIRLSLYTTQNGAKFHEIYSRVGNFWPKWRILWESYRTSWLFLLGLKRRLLAARLTRTQSCH